MKKATIILLSVVVLLSITTLIMQYKSCKKVVKTDDLKKFIEDNATYIEVDKTDAIAENSETNE